MVRNVPPPTAIVPGGGYVVARPRDCDAVGLSLRHVFAVQPPSDDFAELLRRLDRITLPH